MRLLQLGIKNQLSIAYYDGDKVPPYAILRNVLGTTTDDQLTCKGIVNGTGKTKSGYAKIIFCGKAETGRFKTYLDNSCCIKKSSNSERLESLDSMVRWFSRNVTLDDGTE